MNRKLERNEPEKQDRIQEEAFCHAKRFKFYPESQGSP